MHGIDVFEDERQRNDVCFRRNFTKWTEVENSPVQTAKANLLDGIGLIAQNAGRLASARNISWPPERPKNQPMRSRW